MYALYDIYSKKIVANGFQLLIFIFYFLQQIIQIRLSH